MFQFIDFSWSEYTQGVFGLVSYLETWVYTLCHYAPWSTPSLCLFSAATSLFLPSFPFFVYPPLVSWPGSRKDTGSGWGPGFETAFKHGSCYGSWGGRWWWLCVCVLRGGSSCGSRRKNTALATAVAAAEAFPSRGWRWIGEWSDESFPGSSRQEWWSLVSATVKNGRRGRWRLIDLREVVQIWREERETKFRENVLHIHCFLLTRHICNNHLIQRLEFRVPVTL